MRRLAALFLLLAASWPAPLRGATPAADLEAGASATIERVIDGDTLVLDDGVTVRLVGIQAPKLPLGRPGFTAWPHAGEAKAALEEIALGRRVTLYYGGRRIDRYGRALAHLVRDDGLWLQGELLARGMARVYSFRDNRALVADLLAMETQARAAGRGLWRDGFYALRRAEPPSMPLDRFALVEGRVRNVATVRNRTYVNFGDDWREDFTLTLTAATRRLFERDGIDVADLEGRMIRVRGWITSYNGPMITLTHPEQIEFLEP